MAKKLLLNNNGATPVMNGLICWLDGRDGKNGDTVWKDRSGNGNDFELKNFTYDSTNGFIGNCLYFSETTYAQSFKNLDIIIPNITMSDVYIEITFKARKLYTQAWRRILQFPYANTSNRIAFLNNDNTFAILPNEFAIHSNELTGASSILVNGLKDKTQYYNTIGINSVIQTSTNMRVKCFCNGITSDILKETVQTFPYNNKICLNHTSTGDSLNMNIASVLIYNRALTNQEVQQNYNYEKSIQRG